MLDYSNAPTEQMGDFDLIPHGTLAWAILKIKPKGPVGQPGFAPDPNDWVTPSRSTEGGAYLDCELTILEGPYNKRKVFEMIGVAGSDAYVNQGRAAIRAILEVGKGANITSNPGGYRINHYGELDGLKVAVKIKVEKGGVKNAATGERYPDKNRVAKWLTPNKDSDGYKDFERLLKGDTAPSSAAPSVGSGGGSSTPAPTSAAPPWVQQGTGQAPTTPAAPATAKPSWL
jgi:hypothetical protein